jgi:hypothetical protein
LAGETEKELRQHIENLEALISGLTERTQPSGPWLRRWRESELFPRPPSFYGGGPARPAYPGAFIPGYSVASPDPRIVTVPSIYPFPLATAGRSPLGGYAVAGDPYAEAINDLKLELGDLQLALSESFALNEMVIPRVIQVSVFTSADSFDAITSIWEAMTEIFDALGCVIYAQARPESGSWFERWLGKTKEAVTSDAVIERLAKLERAAELKGIDNPQADADLKAAKAINTLLKGMKDTDDGVAVAGSVCVLKRGGVVYSFTLTQEQLTELRKQPLMLRSPEVFEKLLHQTGSGETQPQPKRSSRTIRIPKPKPKDEG